MSEVEALLIRSTLSCCGHHCFYFLSCIAFAILIPLFVLASFFLFALAVLSLVFLFGQLLNLMPAMTCEQPQHLVWLCVAV